MYIYFVYKKKG